MRSRLSARFFVRMFHALSTPLLVAALLLAAMAAVVAGAETVAPATGKQAERQNAVQAIPFRALRPDAARQIHSIVNQASMYRRLPVTTATCDPDLFVFWARNPDVIVGVWEEMGVTEISMRRTGEFSFQASDGQGTTSGLELIYGTPSLHLYKGTGFYQGGLIKRPVRGDCVVLLRSDFRETAAGVTEVVSRMDVFVAIEQNAIELAAKTLQPLFVRYADINFVETVDFLERLSAAAVKQGDRFGGLAERLDNVQPQVQTEFAELAARAKAKRY